MRKSDKKKCFLVMAGSKVLWEDIQKMLLRVHKEAPLKAGGVLGSANVKLILDQVNTRLDQLGVGEVQVKKCITQLNQLTDSCLHALPRALRLALS